MTQDNEREQRDHEIVAIAVENYPWSDGDIELGSEGDSNVMVSEGEDNGAYVRAWVWISFEGTFLDKNTEGEQEE